MVKLRMTMPKKEEDIEKVMEEVMETHPEMAEEHHHHHHHHHHDDELIIVLNSLVDGMNHFNAHLKQIEEKVTQLEKALTFMAKMNAIVYKALLAENPAYKREALRDLESLLKEYSGKEGKAS